MKGAAICSPRWSNSATTWPGSPELHHLAPPPSLSLQDNGNAEVLGELPRRPKSAVDRLWLQFELPAALGKILKPQLPTVFPENVEDSILEFRQFAGSVLPRHFRSAAQSQTQPDPDILRLQPGSGQI